MKDLDEQIDRFSIMWKAMGDMYDRKISSQVVIMAFKILREYDIDEIQIAIENHTKDKALGKYMPNAAGIIERIMAERSRNNHWEKLIYEKGPNCVAARNKCVMEIKKLLPTFKTYEEREGLD